MAVAAWNQNLQVGQATTDILKSFSEGKLSTLTDLHGQELGSKGNAIVFSNKIH